MAASTVRLPPDLDRELSSYCLTRGASKNRVVVLALRSWLSDAPSAPPVYPRHEARDDEPEAA